MPAATFFHRQRICVGSVSDSADRVFSIRVGTGGKRGSSDISIADRYCCDPDDCSPEGEMDVVQSGTDGEPPKGLRFVGPGV